PPARPSPSSPPPASSAPPSSAAPASSAPASSAPASSAPASSAPASEVRGHPGDTQIEKGTLWSDGSVVADGRSQVTLKATTDLTTLELTLRVEPASGLTAAGIRTPVPEKINADLTRDGNALLYRFTLAKGETLKAGTYVFTARYNGEIKNRDATQDTYEAFADTTVDDENKRLHIYGNYFPRD
ncbi:hypothetical protein AB0J83_40690, partial [Actinoplanes sp. NPDC049596]